MVARYEPTWESLGRYTVPQWYEDAKFGIFIHWGVYSVPAFGNEWYPRQMYLQGTPEYAHHVATYGPQERFGYKDFIPRFTGEHFDAGRWADLFARAGARFVVPVAEHHDGFPMYDTTLSEWSAARMGPRRDIVGELAEAVRRQGMVFGVSSHRAEHWWFFNGGRQFPSDVQDERYAGLYGPAVTMPGFEGHDFDSKPWPDQAYLDDWLARCTELVDKYRPQLVWFDWWINHRAYAGHLQRFAAHYYNRGLEWDLGMAINYKFDAFPAGTAVLDIERGQLGGTRAQLWQNDTSVSKNSWGYVAEQDYKSARDLIGDLVDVVSKHGALLLNIGPRPDGTIPEPEQALLLEIGEWLRTNGEAIYGTRPWTVFGEGPTVVEEGSFADTKRAPFTGRDYRFTRKGDAIYAIALDWPGATAAIEAMGLRSPHCPGRVTQVHLLGHSAPLAFTQDDAALRVTMPPQPVGKHAYALEIRL